MNTAEAKAFLARIDPKVHNKFSENLHEFLRRRRNKRLLQEGTTFIRTTNNNLYFGYKDGNDFMGTRVRTILQEGYRATVYCYTDGQNHVAVPEGMDNYLLIGRCVFDPDHVMPFVNADGRFVVQNNKRVCVWCGAKYQLKKIKRVVIDEKWIPCSPTSERKGTNVQ